MAAAQRGEPPRISERQQNILERVAAQGFATVESLAQELGVSGQTVRRDIIHLDSLRLLQRFHGGAGLLDHTVRLGYASKAKVSAERKNRIAAIAAGLIPNGASVFLDVGTTVEAVARALVDHRRLRIFTNSIHCAAIFPKAEHETFVAGGILGGADGSLVGSSVVEALSGFRFDYAVIGCSAIEKDGGAMDYDLRKVAVKQAAMRNSRNVILVADVLKFRRLALVRIGYADEFDFVISDAPLPTGVEAVLRDNGVTVLTEPKRREA